MLPLEGLFRLGVVLRRRRMQARAQKPPVPIIVVGNITLGGTGKTPVLIALVEALKARGYVPGVVSRGYGAELKGTLRVGSSTAAEQVGDEPLMIHQATGVAVVVGQDRVAAAQRLYLETGCDIILSDDGLQHYRLARDIEWVVIDGARGLGNGHCLPVGPLREPKTRLRQSPYVLINGQGAFQWPEAGRFQLKPRAWRNVATGEQLPLDQLPLKGATAIAGIGNPARFFATLATLGFDGPTQAFADHHAYASEDLAPFAGRTLLMTMKDAVKCAKICGPNAWALVVEAQLPQALLARFFQHLNQ